MPDEQGATLSYWQTRQHKDYCNELDYEVHEGQKLYE